ncbi:MAG: penicillin-binding protein [Acidobacteria bacterium]|nr:penicillin-binding protein [Acidobacteriota bacterium]
MSREPNIRHLRLGALVALLAALPASAVPSKRGTPAKKTPVVKSASKKTVAKSKVSASKKRALARTRTGRNGSVAGGPWKEPTYADSTMGDSVDGEDLTVRQAAVDALGPYNGSVVVVDPKSGRILTIVNQKLALRSGFQPCSTIKLVSALAGLHEGVVDRETAVRVSRRKSLNLTEALATSDNPYFARVGVKLGFEKVLHYSKLFGLGERAAMDIDGEFAGTLPDTPPKFGGVGMMMSFGEGIRLTTLQLASLMAAISNGGTLYHLQYPRTPEDRRAFVPRVKRHLEINQEIPEIRPGMMGAAEWGTGRRAFYDPNEPIFGKTGTCTDRTTPTHLGWFGSFNEVDGQKLVVVVLLTGGKAVNGPVAAQVAGGVYKNLSGQRFFARGQSLTPIAPRALTAGPSFVPND